MGGGDPRLYYGTGDDTSEVEKNGTGILKFVHGTGVCCLRDSRTASKYTGCGPCSE